MKKKTLWPDDAAGQKELPETSGTPRSAISQVKPHSYRDTDYKHTGTNLTYQDDGTAY